MPVNLDPRVAATARALVRKYRDDSVLKPPDAIHLATAILWNIPVLESTDPDLLRLDASKGIPQSPFVVPRMMDRLGFPACGNPRLEDMISRLKKPR